MDVTKKATATPFALFCAARSGCYAPTVPSFIKKAGKPPVAPQSDETRWVVAEMLAEIEKHGEEAVRDYARKLDRWTGEIVVTPEEMERRTRDLPAGVKQDIDFATERVFRFALAQRSSV